MERACLVLNPVDVTEELTSRLTEIQKKRFQDAIKTAAAHAKEAIELDDPHEASKRWRKQFGDRFPLVKKEEKKNWYNQAAASIAAIHSGTNPPKPWGWRK